MKNLALKLYFLAIISHFAVNISFASTLNEELSVIVQQIYETGDLSYHQHEYIQNELSSNSSCPETFQLFTILEIQFDSIWETWNSHCSQKKTTPSLEKSFNSQKIQINSAYSENFISNLNNNGPSSGFKYDIKSENISFKGRQEALLEIPHHRILSISWKELNVELGNPKLVKSLPSILGKYYWQGMSNLENSWLFPPSGQLNGGTLNYSSGFLLAEAFGYWNSITDDYNRKDNSILGTHFSLNLKSVTLSWQWALIRMEEAKMENRGSFYNGMQLTRTGPVAVYQFEASHNFNYTQEGTRPQIPGGFASLSAKSRKGESSFKIFQSSSHWDNPLAGPPLRWESDLLDSIPPQKAEGGIWTQNKIPLGPELNFLHFYHAGKYHWSLLDQKTFFVKNDFSCHLNFLKTQWVPNWAVQNSYDGARQSLGLKLKSNKFKIQPIVKYRYNWGSYSGTYPHMLMLGITIPLANKSAIIPEFTLPDIGAPRENAIFGLVQKIHLINKTYLNIRSRYYFRKNKGDSFRLWALIDNSFHI